MRKRKAFVKDPHLGTILAVLRIISPSLPNELLYNISMTASSLCKISRSLAQRNTNQRNEEQQRLLENRFVTVQSRWYFLDQRRKPTTHPLKTSSKTLDEVLTEKVTNDIEHMFDSDAVYKALETVELRTVTMYPSDPSRRTPSGENNIQVKICIKGSTFVGAGLGLFVEEDVPEGYCEEYAGKYVAVENDNPCDVSGYRWTIFEYNEDTGAPLPVPSPTTVGFVDALPMATSNWTRYVNCSKSERSANMVQWQEYNRSYYGTKRPVKKGEELCVWYGPAFARALGLKEDENEE